jgi:hypothetical protein
MLFLFYLIPQRLFSNFSNERERERKVHSIRENIIHSDLNIALEVMIQKYEGVF